jgi:hypothetical protein
MKRKPIAALLCELFMKDGELNATKARKLLKAQGRRTSYPATGRLFYDLRQLGLIEFVREEPGKAPIDKRYHRIIPGMEDDPRWQTNPHHLLYPSSAIGGLDYEIGESVGRAQEYERD